MVPQRMSDSRPNAIRNPQSQVPAEAIRKPEGPHGFRAFTDDARRRSVNVSNSVGELAGALHASSTNARRVIEILRPVRRRVAGTAWVHAWFVSYGTTNTVPSRTRKSILSSAPLSSLPRPLQGARRKARSSPRLLEEVSVRHLPSLARTFPGGLGIRPDCVRAVNRAQVRARPGDPGSDTLVIEIGSTANEREWTPIRLNGFAFIGVHSRLWLIPRCNRCSSNRRGTAFRRLRPATDDCRPPDR